MQKVHHIYVLNQLFDIMTDMNIGPNQNMPVKTLWLQSVNRQIKHEDFVEVLNQSIDTKLMVFTEGGICGLGSIALTEEGYIMSRTSI